MKFASIVIAGLFSVAAPSPVSELPGHGRVTNGSVSPQGQAPFLVRLKIHEGISVSYCGGTLIDPTTVVTAAHCIDAPEGSFFTWPKTVYVYYGDVSASSKQYVQGIKTVVHPDWDARDVKNDIAIVKIPPLKLSPKFVQPIPIYNGQIKPLHQMQVYGWGTTKTGGSVRDMAKTLLTTNVYVSKPKDCQAIERTYTGANGPQICTDNNYNIGADTCQGDSGTGSTISVNGKQYFAGLVSYGTNTQGDATCGEAGGFGVYTRIYHYLPWIQSVVGYSIAAGPYSKPANH